MAKLYMIATPIGNRDDITLRALETIRNLQIFYSEDTREFTKLISLYDIPKGPKKVFSFTPDKQKEIAQSVIQHLEEGKDVGFTCDRGTPGISDPGAYLVKLVRDAGFEVIPVPGVSSVSTLLSVSGIAANEFVFFGFLPKEKNEREKLFSKMKLMSMASVFFESPKRIKKTLMEVQDYFPMQRVLIGREMTKAFEEYRFLSDFKGDLFEERGEYAIVIEPGEPPKDEEASKTEIEKQIRLRSLSDKEWSKELAKTSDLPAKEIYNSLQRLKVISDK